MRTSNSNLWYRVVVKTKSSSTPKEFKGQEDTLRHVNERLNHFVGKNFDLLEKITIMPYPEQEDDERKLYEKLKEKFEKRKEKSDE